MNGLHFSTLSVIIIQNMIGSAHLYVVHISLLCSFVCCALLDITIKAPLCHYSFECYINCLSIILCCAVNHRTECTTC